MSFISIRILDIIDIFLVAYLLYQFYMLIRGTAAINIFIAIATVYLVWLIVKALNMQLLGNILGQVMGVGVIALIIVFQQEFRRFLILIGSRYFSNKNLTLEGFLSFFISRPDDNQIRIYAILKACLNLSRKRTGALIVISDKSNLESYAKTGDILNAKTSSILLESIFFKNSPLHDGAVIIVKDKICAARCILPVSENQNLPKSFGFRHRAAIGISEITDSFVIVVSEETGHLTYVHFGKYQLNVSPTELRHTLEAKFKKSPKREGK